MKINGIKYKKVYFRFYAELNDFLPNEKKQHLFEHLFAGPLKVQEAILSLQVPLSEVDLILVNGESEKFDYWLNDEDYISVYPMFESLDISTLNSLRPQPLRVTQFILDAHLGKLAKYLRMAGFDTLYDGNYEDNEIIDISVKTGRIILTRDKAMLRSKRVNHGYYIRNIQPIKQFKEVITKFDLISQFKILSRCLLCNLLLVKESKENAKTILSSDIILRFDNFFRCPECNRIYWKGSHYDRMNNFICNIINDSKS